MAIESKQNRQTTQDRWSRLKTALQGMEPEVGLSGFEGLVARLLEAFTSESFLLSRSGDQLGDARSVGARTSVQVKRYKNTTRINANDIEGEIHAIRRHEKKLETYVLATTRPVQWKKRLEEIEAETGIDIVVLDWSGQVFPLGALCVSHWDVVRKFTQFQFDADFETWAEEQKRNADVQSCLARLKEELTVNLHTFRKARCVAAQALAQRFSLRTIGASRYDFPIRLSSSVHRSNVEEAFWQWWQSGAVRTAYLEGQEGTGKSWVAARCGWRAVREGKALVLWFDSRRWTECRGIRELLRMGFASFRLGDNEAQDKLSNKAINIWNLPVLLILDGVNEHRATEAADRILADFSQLPTQTMRLLFTTRPLETRPDYAPGLWRADTKKIPVADGYTPEEFAAALHQLDSHVTPQEFSPSLLEIARIPRYLETCLALRKRFGSFENVTKEMVLWEDLLSRIETDSQIRTALKWTKPSDAREILAELATKSVNDSTVEGAQASVVLLNDCFDGRYADIRNDLEELRIVASAEKLRAQVAGSHVRLGWALYIGSKLRAAQVESCAAFVDEIRSWLEPMASEDHRTEALFIALQLTVSEPDAYGPELHRKRAALLYVWIHSHNADVTEARLEFWAGRDLRAYLEFVENFFDDLTHEQAQLKVVQPLVARWLRPDSGDLILSETLRRWLLLTWPDGVATTESFAHGNHRLPVARTSDQVRLSAVAVSLLSLRPDLTMLETLALCRTTLKLSRKKYNDHSMCIKSIEQNIGVLFRWRFTEACLPHLQTLARKHLEDEVMTDGIRRLAASLKLENLPEELRLPPSDRTWLPTISSLEQLKAGKPLFGETTEFPNIFFSGIAHLAVRDDLPRLSNTDQSNLIRMVEAICLDAANVARRERTEESNNLEELWPWLAKYAPEKLAELVGVLRIAACQFDYPAGLHDFVLGTVQSEDADKRLVVLASLKVAGDRLAGKPEHEVYTEWLTEIGLLTVADSELTDWITFVATRQPLTSQAHCYPAPLLIDLRVSPDLQQLAASKVTALEIVTNAGARKPLTEFEFWALVLTRRPYPDANLYNRAKQWLMTHERESDAFYPLALLTCCGTAEQVVADLEDPSFRCRLKKDTLYQLWHFLSRTWEPALKLSYDDLIRSFPHDFVGFILHKTNRKDDFARWGRELVRLGAQVCSQRPLIPTHRGRSHFRLDSNGRVEAVGTHTPNQNRGLSSATPATWGVDYGSWDDLAFTSDSNGERDLDAYVADWEQLRLWENYSFYGFAAEPELSAWSDENPREFVTLAKEFLERVPKSFADRFHLGNFTNAIINSLMRVEPELAYQHLLAGAASVDARTHVGAPDYVMAVWQSGRGSEKHQRLRRRMFEEADHDLEILELTISALDAGASEDLELILSEFLAHESARDRNLAVSILPWIGIESSRQRLEELTLKDKSKWVRRHAEWALNACIQEIACRHIYREALQQTNPVRASALLQQIRPALSKAARWWHPQIEREEENCKANDPISKSLRLSFWYHWQSNSNHGQEVYGRRLQKFCRGEELDDRLTSRLAPWWKPQPRRITSF